MVAGPAPAWTPRAQVEVLSPHVKVVTFCFVPFHCSSFFPPFLMIDFTKESKLLRRPCSGREGQGRQLAKEGRGGVLPKAWAERYGSSGTLLSGTAKYPVSKGPWICPSPTLSFSHVDGRGRDDWNLQPISHWRGKLAIWLCGEGSTLCS